MVPPKFEHSFVFLRSDNGACSAFAFNKGFESGHPLRMFGKFSAKIFLSKKQLSSSGVFLINQLWFYLNIIKTKMQV